MSWSLRWQVVCENCGTKALCPDNDTIARDGLKHRIILLPKEWYGVWFLYGEHHLCPRCKNLPRPKEWPEDVQ